MNLIIFLQVLAIFFVIVDCSVSINRLNRSPTNSRQALDFSIAHTFSTVEVNVFARAARKLIPHLPLSKWWHHRWMCFTSYRFYAFRVEKDGRKGSGDWGRDRGGVLIKETFWVGLIGVFRGSHSGLRRLCSLVKNYVLVTVRQFKQLC